MSLFAQNKIPIRLDKYNKQIMLAHTNRGKTEISFGYFLDSMPVQPIIDKKLRKWITAPTHHLLPVDRCRLFYL